MLVAALILLALLGLIVFLFVTYAHRIPQHVLKFFGYFLLVVSSIESLLIVWILVVVWNSDWSIWTLSFNDFWREQLAPIYFIKLWVYTWFWNDLLDLLFTFLPAIVFLAIRTTLTTVFGFWCLALARR